MDTKDTSFVIGAWFALVTAVLSVFLVPLLTLVDFGLTDGNTFGFYFASPAQSVGLSVVTTLLSTWLAKMLITTRLREVRTIKTTILAANGTYTLLQILLLLVLYAERRVSYGSDDFVSQIPLSLVMIVVFAITSFVLLRQGIKSGGVTAPLPHTASTINGYEWHITSDEQRATKQTGVLKYSSVLLGSIAVVLFSVTNLTIDNIVLTTGAVAIAFVLFFLINRFFPYRARDYQLDDTGVYIGHGAKQGAYTWDQFACFYRYSKRAIGATLSDPLQVGALSADVSTRDDSDDSEGEIYYLKLRRPIFGIFGKVFVVIHSAPGTAARVHEILAQKLTEQPMAAGTDMGLVLYRFK